MRLLVFFTPPEYNYTLIAHGVHYIEGESQDFQFFRVNYRRTR